MKFRTTTKYFLMKRSNMAAVTALTISGLTMFLAGCSAASDADFKKVQNTPEDNIPELTPGWVQVDDTTIKLYLYGSSSCPPEVEQVSLVDSGVEIRLKQYLGMCTADYGGPTVWQVTDLPLVTDDFTVRITDLGRSTQIERFR